jgi:hypothetical protein
MKAMQTNVILAQRLKAGAEFRLHANSVEPVCLEVRKLAARQVFKGESGKLQDLINFTLLALCNYPDLADKLYMEGKGLYNETLNTGVVPKLKLSNEMPS